MIRVEIIDIIQCMSMFLYFVLANGHIMNILNDNIMINSRFIKGCNFSKE